MKSQQILIDALYQIACGTKLQTREEMIDAAEEALAKFMVIADIEDLPLTKGVNDKPITQLD